MVVRVATAVVVMAMSCAAAGVVEADQPPKANQSSGYFVECPDCDRVLGVRKSEQSAVLNQFRERGMSTVYQAFHIHLAKHVALKILPAGELRSRPSVERFRQETRAVGKVNHPNIVTASDAADREWDGR
jgi:hypothetical protein